MVQSRLFPKTRLNCGNYYVFGKSVPMAQLGGDYFDYFLSKQGKLCILMGDVAGHGVGSSLIMAMAKAGVIYQGDRAEDPAAMLKGLHQMILHTRNKSQRKIMTFQYLCLDADLEAGKYANAGGCAPLLVDINKKSVCEINLTAPVLGGFKNSHYANISVDLKAGQAIIFYTDGIIESRNRFNEELGYERFQQMALNCWEEEPENYYQRLYDACIAWRGEVPAQDDMTMVILQRKKNNGKYCC
jgi:sigma-B regulation protein RsbU (phosphoserine phosphatase)